MLRNWSLQAKTGIAFLVLCGMMAVLLNNPEIIKQLVNLFTETKEVVIEDQAVEEIPMEEETSDEFPSEVVEREPIPEPEAISDVFTIVEEMPRYPGGQEELFKFIVTNLKKYPTTNQKGRVQGTVYVSFVVMESGEIKQIKIKHGVEASLDEAARSVVKSMPNWIPGKQRGKPVRVAFTLPIHFEHR